MIIQCEQCQTKFRLDDSKVTDKGVKVRCAKCKQVFTVRKEQSEAAAPQPDFSALLDESVSSGYAAEAAAQPPAQQESPVPVFSAEPSDDSFDTASDDSTGPAVSMDTFSFDPPNYDKQDKCIDEVVSCQESPEKNFLVTKDEQIPTAAADDFSFSSLDEDNAFALKQEETSSASAEVDFGDFDFGDVQADADKSAVESTDLSSQVQSTVPDDDPSSFDFGGDALFGDVVVVPAAEEPAEAITFDFQMDEFADSMGVDTSAVNAKTAKKGEVRADEPFNLGEIDFGDELTSVAVQQVHPDELQPSQELLFAPLAEAQVKPVQSKGDTVGTAPAAGTSQADQEELPPLSIGSRRKQSSVFGVLIAVVSLIVVAVLGFFGYSMFTEDKGKVVTESGRITVRSVEASYVKNPLIGDLLVITGEAVNEYTKPRAAIQIKGMVYGANGQVLVTKNSYCGNPLTKEQLATLPADKIEAAMANQFGDSLANMEVAVGKAIPFVIVIAKPPADAKDYGVEPAGSTVATGK